MLFDLRPLDIPPETAPFRFVHDTCRHPTAKDGVLSASLNCDSIGYWHWGASHHVAWPSAAEAWLEAEATGVEPEHADALAAAVAWMRARLAMVGEVKP